MSPTGTPDFKTIVVLNIKFREFGEGFFKRKNPIKEKKTSRFKLISSLSFEQS